jgi:hypothetical protein
VSQPVLIRLRLSWSRYGFVVAMLVILGLFMLRESLLPSLAHPELSLRSQEIGRMLMSLDRVGGVWPLPLLLAIAFLGGALFYLWALAAPRPFALELDAKGASWPSLAPWRKPWSFAWSEITGVARNARGDHVVFQTTRGRKVMPAWWLPDGTSLDEVIRAADALRRG